MNDTVKNIADATAIGVAGAAFVEWMPPVAALVSAINIGLRTYEWIEHRWRKGNQT